MHVYFLWVFVRAWKPWRIFIQYVSRAESYMSRIYTVNIFTNVISDINYNI